LCNNQCKNTAILEPTDLFNEAVWDSKVVTENYILILQNIFPTLQRVPSWRDLQLLYRLPY